MDRNIQIAADNLENPNETVAQPQAKIPTSSIKYSEVFFAFEKSVYFPNPGSGGGSGIDFCSKTCSYSGFRY